MTMAWSIEDDKLENQKWAVIQDGDPMAMHAWKRLHEEEEMMRMQSNDGCGQDGTDDAQQQQRPIYKGLQPKPNWYGMCLGCRWDGIDSSLLATQ